MTPSERIARADRAKAALAEFLAPAFAHVEQDYSEKLITAAASVDPRAPEIIARLANGVKAARTARGLIEAFVMDGKMAEQELQGAAKVQRMTPFHRSVIGV